MDTGRKLVITGMGFEGMEGIQVETSNWWIYFSALKVNSNDNIAQF